MAVGAVVGRRPRRRRRRWPPSTSAATACGPGSQARFDASPLPFCVTGWGSLLCVHPVPARRSPADLDDADPRWRDLFFHDLLDAGFYTAPRGHGRPVDGRLRRRHRRASSTPSSASASGAPSWLVTDDRAAVELSLGPGPPHGARRPGLRRPAPDRPGRPPPPAPGVRPHQRDPGRLRQRARAQPGAAAVRPPRPAPAHDARRRHRRRRAVRVLGAHGGDRARAASTACSAGGWPSDHQWQAIDAARAATPGFVDEVLERIRDRRADHRRPTSSSASARRASWWSWDDGKIALEHLFHHGEVVGRPPAAATSPGSTTCPSGCCRRARWPPRRRPRPRPARSCSRSPPAALGVATLDDLADYHRQEHDAVQAARRRARRGGRPAAGDGRGLDASRRTSTATPRCRGRSTARALLSPFDSLVWYRDRNERLFDFHYRIEIYVAGAEARSTATTCCRSCSATASSGRVDLKADRAAGVLRVQGAYVEPGVDADGGRRPRSPRSCG